MNLSDAVKSIIRPHKEDQLTPLTTIWGEQLDTASPLPEYPRPQLKRDHFTSLNGYWDYAFTTSRSAPDSYDGKILVPFSPESSLSGVNRQLHPGEFLWYRTILPDDACTLPENTLLLLHFGAVDHHVRVFLNGIPILSHQGGYLPFEVEIKDFLRPTGNELILRVSDTTGLRDEAKGKQTLERGGIFYTAQSGIWQSVWLEQVPFAHLENIWFTADYDRKRVTAHVQAATNSVHPILTVSLLDQGKEIVSGSMELSPVNFDPVKNQPASLPYTDSVTVSLTLTIPEEHFHPWSPEDPFLYDVALSLTLEEYEDHASSYFAMRIFSIEKQMEGSLKGKPVFCLNHRPYFLMGVLDQGYWPDGLYTAPSDEALIYDISTMKSLGFNMIRKHIKVECPRWYYHCDRLGMIVCQDMVNGGSKYHMPVISYLPTLFPFLASHLKDTHSSMLSRKDKKARKEWKKECADTVTYLRFFPSIAIWVAFNEGWGQFDTIGITNMIRSLDPSRAVDSASGWFDQRCGDFFSVHNYFRPLSVPSLKKWRNRAYFLSEYGGFACHLKGHASVDRVFGYKRFDTLEEYQEAYQKLIQKSLLPLKEQGLSGAVYTQLSDIEEEVNGILTYDRKINKLTH